MSSGLQPLALSRQGGEVGRLRLGFLDGLRGISSLLVVLHHGLLEVSTQTQHNGFHFSPLLRVCTSPLLCGRFGVDIFIVLSGFCLALPLARNHSDRLDSIPKFLARRCWRILPPYYIALLLSILLILVVPPLSHRSGNHWDIVLPALTFRAIVSHLLLIHNWSSATAYRINHAMWSVATEFQIYLLFPVLLLPIRRWLGVTWLVLISFALGISVHRYFPSMDDARPWYLGLFTLGMAAAECGFSNGSISRGIQRNALWISLAILPLLGLTQLSCMKNQIWMVDAIVGLFAAATIVGCMTGSSREHRRPSKVVRFLENRTCVWLGAMSYSLYLIHPPMVALCNNWGQHLGLNAGAQVVFVLSTGSALSLIAAQLFFILVESRFIPNKVKDPVSPRHEGPAIIPLLVRKAAA